LEERRSTGRKFPKDGGEGDGLVSRT
jgi:hypothetical protein